MGIWSCMFENEFLRENMLYFMEGVYFEDEEFIRRKFYFVKELW